ncbi:MAG: HAD-IA family hydrolase [Pseudomonadota bacterium]
MSDLCLLLFDCDGTLVDSLGHINGAMDEAFAAAGEPPPGPGALKPLIGLSLPRVIARLAPRASEATRATLFDEYRAAYTRRASDEAEPLFDGMADALSALEGDDTLFGIATGKSRRGLDRILTTHGLGERFIVTVSADEAASKPAPEMVEIALRTTGAARERTVMIGDSTLDMTMARSAGVAAVGVSWGSDDPADLRAAGALDVAKHPADLKLLIDGALP